MKIAIASDHAGYRYKTILTKEISRAGHEMTDFGTDSDAPVDYPDFIRRAAEAVARRQCDRGIVIGGSGNGEAIVANRTAGIRCALCWNVESARLTRAHNDANMISIGQRMISEDMARAVVETWLTTPFDSGRHSRRIAKIDAGQEDG